MGGLQAAARDNLLNNPSLPEPLENQSFIPAAEKIFYSGAGDSKYSCSEITNSPEKAEQTKHPKILPCKAPPPMLPTGPSIPLYKDLAMVPGQTRDPHSHVATPKADASQEDEWKNIKVLSLCKKSIKTIL